MGKRKTTRTKRGRKGRTKRTKRAQPVGTSVLYCLVNHGRETEHEERSYIGITNDLRRRLGQHNGKSSGGALYTTLIKRRTKRPWKVNFVVAGIQKRRHVAQLEWRMHRSFKAPRENVFGPGSGARRALQLYKALQMERVTKTAPRNTSLAPMIFWKSHDTFEIAQTLPGWPPRTEHVDASFVGSSGHTHD